ncbi:hypothetical protein ATANTOWER_021630 [Ataeniobius toweri]|uniref:Uncharacterized protein n=1 Tax=Ataeniobius toweri TaxID=208326 RepID=A0ABU7AUS8_9TELE|nr:hypothetical protein [Ataeniobius toweri]
MKTRDRKGQSDKDNQSGYRKCNAGPRKFKIMISKQWKKIKPKHRGSQLIPPWTDTLYHQFMEKNPFCTLSFKYQHVKMNNSRKKKSPFFHAAAKCTFNGCNAIYTFSKKRNPKSEDKKICFTVKRFGEVTHHKKHRRFRADKYRRRGKIGKSLVYGVSHYYYSMLKQTSTEQIMAAT